MKTEIRTELGGSVLGIYLWIWLKAKCIRNYRGKMLKKSVIDFELLKYEAPRPV